MPNAHMPDDRRHPLDSGRDHSHGTENDNLSPRGDNPPRPATEPAGAEHSTKTDKTLTDPATGHPQEA